MDDRGKWWEKESGKSILAEQHDDEESNGSLGPNTDKTSSKEVNYLILV